MNRAFILLASLVALAGCGFQLRGQESLPFNSVYVSGDAANPTIAQLRQAIAAAPGTRLSAKPDEAQAALYVMSVRQEKFILSLNVAGRVREYDLRLTVTYRLLDREGDELIPPSQILLNRVLPWNETQVLAKAEEEQILYRDMQADAVQQIMRRLSATKFRS